MIFFPSWNHCCCLCLGINHPRSYTELGSKTSLEIIRPQRLTVTRLFRHHLHLSLSKIIPHVHVCRRKLFQTMRLGLNLVTHDLPDDLLGRLALVSNDSIYNINTEERDVIHALIQSVERRPMGQKSSAHPEALRTCARHAEIIQWMTLNLHLICILLVVSFAFFMAWLRRRSPEQWTGDENAREVWFPSVRCV